MWQFSFSACAEPLLTATYWNASKEFHVVEHLNEGWYNYLVDGQQYVVPTVDDLQYLDFENSEIYDDPMNLFLGFSAIEGLSTI